MRGIKRQWDEEAEEALGELVSGARRIVLDDIERGAAELMQVEGNGFSGWLLTRIETNRETHERDIHIIAYRGTGHVAMVNELRRLCKPSGCIAVRFEAPSSRPGVQRLFAMAGWNEIERIYRVKA